MAAGEGGKARVVKARPSPTPQGDGGGLRSRRGWPSQILLCLVSRRAKRYQQIKSEIAQGEVVTGGWGHPERAHDVGPIIDPVAILLGAVGG